MITKRSVVFGAALAAGLLTSGAGQAATISYADAMTVLARDCGADVKKFCKGLNLGNGAIRNCLVENQAKVSPVCTASLAAVAASIQTRLAAQASVAKICRADASRRCQGVVQGEAYILDCLVKAADHVTKKCNAAITDAGWR